MGGMGRTWSLGALGDFSSCWFCEQGDDVSILKSDFPFLIDFAFGVFSLKVKVFHQHQ